MRRISRWSQLFIALIGGLLVGGGSRDPEVFLDLASGVFLADREAPWDVILFGMPGADAHEFRGFASAPIGPREYPFRFVMPSVKVALDWEDVSPRLAVLDVAPSPELAGHVADIVLNHDFVGHIKLGAARRRVAVELPVANQRVGRNMLRVLFDPAWAHDLPEGGPPAARLYGLWIGSPADPALTDLLLEKAPPIFSRERRGPTPRLRQVGPSELFFALRMPAHAELRFTPELDPLARAVGGSATFRVTSEAEGGSKRELWRGTIEKGQPALAEVVLPLGDKPGTLVRLGLAVGASPRDRFSWGVWVSPRVLGERPGTVEDEAGERPDETRSMERVRSVLSGANVVLIILDAASAKHFSCLGYSRSSTPEIDRIASEGVVFEEAYSPVGFTPLAMASVWTSQYPAEHHRGVPLTGPLPKAPMTLAELLGRHGIATAAMVNNVLAGSPVGLNRGFADFQEILRREPVAAKFERLVEPWIKKRLTGRAFAYVHFREPHFPYDPPPPFDTLFGPDGPLPRSARTKEDWSLAVNLGKVIPSQEELEDIRRLYDGNLAYVDHAIGTLRRSLEAAGLWERTVFIIAGDHGEALGEHGAIGHVDQISEEVLHIPLIVRFPETAGLRGIRVKGLVSLLGLAPTVADLFGVPSRAGREGGFRGRSLLPMIFGAPGDDFVVSSTHLAKATYAFRSERFKYVDRTALGEEHLFDVKADPAETRDVLGEQPLRALYLREALGQWLIDISLGESRAIEKARFSAADIENLRTLGYVQ
jgi:arylsulfatase A-like enzyme